MTELYIRWQLFWNRPRERGQTLVEYALIILLIAIALVLALGLLGNTLIAFYESVAGEFGALGY